MILIKYWKFWWTKNGKTKLFVGEDGIQLAITGPEAQRALALRQDGALTKVQRNKGKRGGPGESGDQSGPSGSGRKRKSKPKKSSVPKVGKKSWSPRIFVFCFLAEYSTSIKRSQYRWSY